MLTSAALAAALFVACSSDDTTQSSPKDAGGGGPVGTLDGSFVPPLDGGGTDSGGGDAGTASDGGADGAGASDGGADASDAGIDASFDGSPPGDAGVDPTFTNVYNVIISGTCTGCHGGNFPSGSLNMGAQATAYANLVNVTSAGPACGIKMEKRVLPNDHANSLIWNKINGTQDCGSRMPLGGGALSQEKIDLMAEWIDLGAPNN